MKKQEKGERILDREERISGKKGGWKKRRERKGKKRKEVKIEKEEKRKEGRKK